MTFVSLQPGEAVGWLGVASQAERTIRLLIEGEARSKSPNDRRSLLDSVPLRTSIDR